MSIRNIWVRREIIEIALYLFIVVLVGFILPLVAGFSGRGFEESITSGLINISDYLGTYLIYLFFLIASLFLIIYPIVSLITIRKGEHPAAPGWCSPAEGFSPRIPESKVTRIGDQARLQSRQGPIAQAA